MFCESCGHEVESSDKFCPYCGKSVTAAQEETIYLANEKNTKDIKEHNYNNQPDFQVKQKFEDEDYKYETDVYSSRDIYMPHIDLAEQKNVQYQNSRNVIQMQKKWPARLLTGLLLTAVIVLAVNIAVGLIYLRHLDSQDDNYELPDLNITEPDEANI